MRSRGTPHIIGGAERIPKNEHRFAPPKQPWEVLFKCCLRCKQGDLTWDSWFEEWVCQQCAHREYESIYFDPVTRRSE